MKIVYDILNLEFAKEPVRMHQDAAIEMARRDVCHARRNRRRRELWAAKQRANYPDPVVQLAKATLKKAAAQAAKAAQ